jgi:putative membrane protein
LIAASGICIIIGVVLIRTGHRDLHKKAMILASILAFIFVILYITRTSLYPVERYAGEHRSLYLSVLWSHTVMSLVNLPLAVITIFLGLKGRFERHKKIAPYTAAVWIFVAASGWTIFLFHG